MSNLPNVDEAVAVLRRGGLVAFPTETVYGLGCDAQNVDALRRLYEVKQRPKDHPVIVHLPDESVLAEWASDVPATATKLAGACWPGPLTLVLRRATRVPDAVTGGRDTVGLRVPGQPTALALLDEFGGGVAAPSANRFGRVSPTTAADVRADLGDDVDVVLDDGPCQVGVESTIVDCTADPPAILRLGGVPVARIEELVGGPIELRTHGETAAPGTFATHYAPAARVLVVNRGDAAARAATLLASGARVAVLTPLPVPDGLPAGADVLDPPADTDEYARVLYASLREADRRGIDVVAVPSSTGGIGAAINDRLTRAASGSAR